MPIHLRQALDHGVGYGAGAYAPIRFKEKPYWILKNSWGESWVETDITRSAEVRMYEGWTRWTQL